MRDIRREPDEHVRFAAYLDELRQVTDADEVDVISGILTDPDQTMARSAVLRHLDRRAADLHAEPVYEEWAQTMALTVIRHDFLVRRLQEWSLFRAITRELPWQHGELLASSDWLQLKAAAASNTEAGQIFADSGRTKRIRTTARTSLKSQRRH